MRKRSFRPMASLLVLIALLALHAPLARADVPGPVVEQAASPIRVTGLFQNDWVEYIDERDATRALTDWYNPGYEPFPDATEIRRARLGIEGELSPNLEFNLEYDLADGQAEPADVYLGITKLPLVGAIRIGHQFEPLSRLTGSSKHLVFLEKPLPSALSPGRNTGIRVLSDWMQKRMTFSAGVFRETDLTGANGGNEGYNLTARLTGLPVDRESGRRLIHLGAAYSRKNPKGDPVRFQQRPEAHLAPYLVSTGSLLATHVDLLAFEAAAVLGPASLKGEDIQAVVAGPVPNGLQFSGYYITAGWTLTGEHRPYNHTSASFGEFVPRREFDLTSHTYGAWMLLVRISHIDLQDHTVEGGTLTDLSLGLNWYLNANTRLAWNYILAVVDADEEFDLQIAQMRVQVHL